MSTHTRGPWTLKHVSGSNFAVQRFEIRGTLGDRPGILPIFSKDTTAIDGATICCSPENANLIAAAPELLEALKGLLDAHANPDQRICCSGIHCGCMGATTYQQAEHYARAAIAKARGTS